MAQSAPAQKEVKEEAAAAPSTDLRARARVALLLVEKWFRYVPIAAAVLVYARIIQLGFYSQPQADDFDYSVLYTRYGFWGAQVKWFYGWNGRYFFNAATTASVVLVDISKRYWLIPTFLFALVFGCHYYAVRKALPKASQLEAALGAVVFSAFLVLTSPVRSDAYYWATGVFLYPLANCSLALWLVSAARLYAADEKKTRLREAGILIATAFVTIGCNETSMIVIDAIAGVALMGALIWRRRVLVEWLAVIVCCVAFSILVVKAPGNAVRESFMVHRADFKFAFNSTTEQWKTTMWAWCTQPLLLVTTILGWPFLQRAGEELHARVDRLRHPLIPVGAFAFTAFLVWLSIFPSWWSKGAAAIPRTLDVSYAVFLMGWAIGCAFLAGLRVAEWKPGFVRVMTPLLSVAFVYLAISHETYVSTVKDLNTTAPLYRRELRQRYAEIRAAKARGEENVVVEGLKNHPKELYVLDLFACSDGWPNSSYAEHFDVWSVRPRGVPMGSCGAVPPAAQKVVNPYSIHLFRPKR